MKQLTDKEYLQEIDEGTGVLHFMGGIGTQNGKEIILVDDGIFLFEKWEVGSDDWHMLVQKSRKECEDYLQEQKLL